MNIKLLGDRVIARLITTDKTEGGILLPESASQTATHRMAQILGVGPGIRNENGELVAPEVKIGQRVLMDFAGGWLDHEGERLILSTARNVLAILE